MKNITLVFILLLSSITLQNCTESIGQSLPEEEQEEVKTVAVKIGEVKSTSQPLAVETSGMLGIKDEAKLAFKIGGIIETVYVEEGDFVKEGQILATLNKAEIDAQVRQAEIGLEKSKRDLVRVQKLYDDTVATLEQVQDLTTGREMANARLDIAKFNQKHAVIYAPTSGKIQRKLAQKGEVTAPGNPIFIMSTTGDAKVMRVGLTDKDVVRTRIGDRATLQFDAHPGINFTARVVDIAENPNPRTGTYEVELMVSSKGYLMKNGFVGKAKLYPSRQQPYLKIPVDAIVEASRDKVTLYTPKSDMESVEQIQVTPISIEEDFFTAAPNANTQDLRLVVTEGAKYISKNSRIEIVK